MFYGTTLRILGEFVIPLEEIKNETEFAPAKNSEENAMFIWLCGPNKVQIFLCRQIFTTKHKYVHNAFEFSNVDRRRNPFL